MPTIYEPGTTLEVRGELWRLAHAERFDTCTILTLEGRDRENAGGRLRIIDPFDRPRIAARRRPRRRSRRAVLTTALASMAWARAPRGIWTAAEASIALWPYQLEPALAVIRGTTRVLLADAVGLGKTVQAGLILSELRERGWIRHALIVCPAGLRHSWHRELRSRFQVAATVLDQVAVASRLAELPPGVNPWAGHAVVIASIDFIKRAEVLAAVASEPVDLLIVDEAHHLAPGTDRAAAVSQIASRTPWCVFASATPHSGDRAAFDHLTSMGAAGDPIAIFRRRRCDVGLAVTRRTHLLPVQPRPAEHALIEAVTNYATAIWRARGRDDHAVRLVAATLARRAASSPTAIARTLTRRLALLRDATVEAPHPQLPWDEDDHADDSEPDALLSARGLADVAAEAAAIEQLIALASSCDSGAKLRRIERVLAASREPAVIFTEYRDTLDAIYHRLATSGLRVGAIHGGLPPTQRRLVVDAFNAGEIDVLVATDAAGEGLNLHHRCRLVVDNELPWNPLRLEQRVGRVDRLGQQRSVHAIRLFHPHSIEHTVLDRLRLRSRRAEEAFEANVSEAEIAAAVFDGRSIDHAAAEIRSDIVAAAVDECARLERQRRHGGASMTRVWSAPKRHRPTDIIALYRSTFVNEAGVLAAEQMHGVRFSLQAMPRSRREWQMLVEDLPRRHDAFITPQTLGTLEGRVASIRARLQRDLAVGYQGSLFDSRTDHDATARRLLINRLDAALDRALRSATSPADARATRTELIAAWPVRP